MHVALAGCEALDARRGVDVEVCFVLGDFAHSLKCAWVVVVLCTEQENYLLAASAKGPQECRDGVVYIVKGRISPNAGAVEKVARYDADIRLLLFGYFYDVFHAGEGVLPAGVLPVSDRAVEVAEVRVGGVEYLHCAASLWNRAATSSSLSGSRACSLLNPLKSPRVRGSYLPVALPVS